MPFCTNPWCSGNKNRPTAQTTSNWPIHKLFAYNKNRIITLYVNSVYFWNKTSQPISEVSKVNGKWRLKTCQHGKCIWYVKWLEGGTKIRLESKWTKPDHTHYYLTKTYCKIKYFIGLKAIDQFTWHFERWVTISFFCKIYFSNLASLGKKLLT